MAQSFKPGRENSADEVRTRHVDADGAPLYTNYLVGEKSPYLRQHAHNPVAWHPWGQAAFDKAADEDKPVFLSVGYSTCHWCHVMEEESFDDTEVAERLNRSFVAIKVDREQRPDVDEIYMAGVQVINGRGGWPMSSFLTPAGKPFFAATYIPKPQFLGLLDEVARVWQGQRDRLLADAENIDRGIRRQLAPSAAAALPDGLIDRATQALVEHADREHGGFGDAPKFPQEPNLLLLLEQVQRDARPLAEQPLWAALRGALDALLQGGIYDQVGGGFHRYATDRAWQVPHFEKMLYNQGQLAAVFIWAWQLSGELEYRRIVEETLDYLLREMRSPRGGFYSATDADSEGEEGRYFVWHYHALADLLDPDDLKLCEQVFAVRRAGNFAGANIFYLPQPLDVASQRLGLSRDVLDARLAAIKARLYAARRQRVAPLRDDKQITEWNAMVIAALAQAGRALGRADYRQAAITAAEELWAHHHDDTRGVLWRTSLDGVAAGAAQLEDYAHFIDALIALYDTTGDSCWLDRARALLEQAKAHHWDDDAGGFFTAPAKTPGPQLLRSKSCMDGATVSGNSLMLLVLIGLQARTGAMDLDTLIERQIAAFSGHIAELPLAGPVFLQGLLRRQNPTPSAVQYLAGGAIRASAQSETIADARARVTLTLEIEAGWHIQGQTRQDRQATQLSVANAHDWHEQRLDYPPPDTGPDGESVFTGTTVLYLEAQRKAPAPLIVDLRLTPCTDRECLPVQTARFVLHSVAQN